MIEPNHPAPQYADHQIIEALHGGHVHRFNRTYGDGDTSLTLGAVASIANLVNSASRAAFDAGREYERATNTEDDRPWEPLNKDDPLNVGDEVRRDHGGTTSIAVVGRVDKSGDPWTAEGKLIGLLRYGTWHVRRPVQELPTEDGAVIVPAEGREFIEAEVAGQTFIAREAVVCQSDFGPANVLEGAWRRADTGARVGGQVSRVFITPGTWKVERE